MPKEKQKCGSSADVAAPPAADLIRQFQIAVPDSALEDLQSRLRTVRWPDTLENSGWSLGADFAYIKSLVEYWRTEFDWRARERELNTFHHNVVEIDGIDVHFVLAPGAGPRRIPLLLTHGWPATFVELLKLVPLLTRAGSPVDRDLTFDLVLPSIPGFGFSGRPTKRGVNNFRVADMWVKLMARLGYERFGLQGGDFGAGVNTALSLKHPERVIGMHLNYIPGSYRAFVSAPTDLTDEEQQFLAAADHWYAEEGGYAHQQRTKPQTLAFALNDSPVGLAAWIVEKYRGWSDCRGHVERRFSRDEVLVQVMIYWVTETIHSSMRYYYENRFTPFQFTAGQRVEVPCAIAHFPLEAPFPPRKYIERGYRVERWTEMPRGGHFASHEEPEMLANDVRAFFGELLTQCHEA